MATIRRFASTPKSQVPIPNRGADKPRATAEPPTTYDLRPTTYDLRPTTRQAIIAGRVSTKTGRIRPLHVVRRAGWRQRRALLQLRPPQSGVVGLRAGAAGARPGPRIRAVCHRHVRHPVGPDPGRVARQHRRGRDVFVSLAIAPGHVPVRCEWCGTGVRGRTMVDRPERGLAA